ncbi:MAG: adenosylcobinamide-GDP ribazoletransferase [Lachnospiraceae bacterium]|nr:adenosylcobinamide-GDP ribazoletransferase [Lachnospiraceae bacterium]
MIFRAILLALSTYSRLPMPMLKLKGGEERLVLPCLPLVGAVLGAAELLLYLACRALALPDAALVLLLSALPLLFTGGIHTDGLIDTEDARNSFRSREDKIRILKDPHVGAFGVLRLLLFFMLLWAGLFILLKKPMPVAVICVYLPGSFVFSRSLCALLSLLLPSAKESGMLYQLKKGGRGPAFLPGAVLTGLLVLYIFTDIKSGVLYALLQAILLLYYIHMTKKEFGGDSGDTAGWLICMSEWTAVAALSLATLWGGL